MTEQMTTVAPEGGAAAGNAQPNVGENTTTSTFDFMGALSPEFKNHPSITKFGGDINKLSKSYIELQSLMGQSKVAIPKDENDGVAWGLYDTAFGVPDTADKYDLKAPDGVSLTEFKELMKANHIAPSVAQKLLDAHLGEFDRYDQAMQQQAQAEQAEAEKQLKQEWGAAYDEKMQKAAKFLEKMSGSKEENEYFLSKIGNDTRFIKFLARMGDSISEGTLGGMEGQVQGFTRTPSEAKAEFDRIMADPNDAYFAGVKNHRNDMAWCREHNQSYVSEQERKERVAYIESLMQMMG
jgi:hypothetical protein